MFMSLTNSGWPIADFLVPRVHGGEQGAGLAGLLDSFLDAVTRGFGPGPSGNPMAGIETLGSNIHPLLVHFPIVFLSTFFVFEIVGLLIRNNGLRQFAGGMLYLGALSAIAAAVAGLLAEETVPHGEIVHEIMEWHERAGLTVASLAVVLAGWRAVVRGHFAAMGQALHLLLSLVMVVCLFFGADLGGLMVYQFGVGVKNLQQADEHHEHPHHGD